MYLIDSKWYGEFSTNPTLTTRETGRNLTKKIW